MTRAYNGFSGASISDSLAAAESDNAKMARQKIRSHLDHAEGERDCPEVSGLSVH